MWGLQVRPRSPRWLPHPCPPAAPILAQSVLFFCPDEPGELSRLRLRATATLGAGVNQSPERRGAAARRALAGGRAGGRGEAEAAQSGGPEEIWSGEGERPRQKEREAH